MENEGSLRVLLITTRDLVIERLPFPEATVDRKCSQIINVWVGILKSKNNMMILSPVEYIKCLSCADLNIFRQTVCVCVCVCNLKMWLISAVSIL